MCRVKDSPPGTDPACQEPCKRLLPHPGPRARRHAAVVSDRHGLSLEAAAEHGEIRAFLSLSGSPQGAVAGEQGSGSGAAQPLEGGAEPVP